VPIKVGLEIGAKPVIALSTNAVVASCVVLLPAVAVGAVGVPVKAGLRSGANVDRAFAVVS
jgi:hypothetical protein